MKLTQRQMEILFLIASGYGDKEISEKLEISKLTVKQHVRDIYKRLKARNRANAVAIAYQTRLLSVGTDRDSEVDSHKSMLSLTRQ